MIGPLTFACAVILLAGPRVAEAPASSDDAYCGLYAMYAALSAIGLTPDFDGMNDSKYLSGKVGSTATDLMNLARQQGSTATYCSNLSIADLRHSQYPIVLHTRSLVSRAGFHHWILFLGWEGNVIKVYDPPRGRYTLSPAELLSEWDGIGVVVGRQNMGWRWTALNIEIGLAFLLVTVFVVLLLRYTRLRNRPLTAILAASAAAATVWHAIVTYGFIGNRSSLNTIAAVHYSGGISTIGDEEFMRLMGRHDITLIDARPAEAYRKQHIPGAINVPITVTYGAFRDVLANIPVANQVVLYCRSEECSWADTVGHLFPTRGYDRVMIFSGGMVAWKRMTDRKSSESTGPDGK